MRPLSTSIVYMWAPWLRPRTTAAAGFCPLTKAALDVFIAAHRSRSVALLTKAYDKISTSQAAGFTGIPVDLIGVSESEIEHQPSSHRERTLTNMHCCCSCAAMAEAGWSQDGDWLVAPKDPPPAADAADRAAGMQQLQQLTVRLCPGLPNPAAQCGCLTIPCPCVFRQEYIVKIGS